MLASPVLLSRLHSGYLALSCPVLSCLVFALFRFYAIVNRETSEKNQARVAQAAKKNVCELRLSLLVGQ